MLQSAYYNGKKDIFLEDIEYTDKQIKKEQEADNFAEKMTLTKSEEAEIINSKDYSTRSIKRFAKKIITYPAGSTIYGSFRQTGGID